MNIDLSILAFFSGLISSVTALLMAIIQLKTERTKLEIAQLPLAAKQSGGTQSRVSNLKVRSSKFVYLALSVYVVSITFFALYTFQEFSSVTRSAYLTLSESELLKGVKMTGSDGRSITAFAETQSLGPATLGLVVKNNSSDPYLYACYPDIYDGKKGVKIRIHFNRDFSPELKNQFNNVAIFTLQQKGLILPSKNAPLKMTAIPYTDYNPPIN